MDSRSLALFSLILLFVMLLVRFPAPASAQGDDLFLREQEACREDPHSQECICADVRKLGYFPAEFNPDGTPKDVDGDGLVPEKNDAGFWVDVEGEMDDGKSGLVFMLNDRYSQHCSLSYFREDQRRLWHFAVALGAGFTVVSLIWLGVTHMQNTASGVDVARTRTMLVRVLIGVVILACSVLAWEGVNEFLFHGIDSWTLDRGVFYDPR